MKLFPVIYLISLFVRTAPAAPSGCRKRPSDGINIRIRGDNVIDLTHVTNEKSAHWPDISGFKMTNFIYDVTGIYNYFYTYNDIVQTEHVGTHMDSPVHFSKTGLSVDEVSLENLIGIGVLLDLTTDGKRFNETVVTVDHFLEWEQKNGQIRSGSIVLIRTGFGEIYDDTPTYYGTSLTGSDAVPHLKFPGLGPDAARWLTEKRCISAVGIDTMSIDEGQSPDFMTHRILANANVPNFENVANLDKLAATNKRFKVIALPYNMENASGAPVRIIAVTS